MTDLRALADCVCSGQVPDECVPGLVAETPGLREETERRSRSTSPVLTVEAGRGDSISSPDVLRPADPFADILFDDDCRSDAAIYWIEGAQARLSFLSVADFDAIRNSMLYIPEHPVPLNSPNLPSQGALSHRLGEEKGGGPLKTRRLVFQFIRSLHPASFLRKLMRK